MELHMKLVQIGYIIANSTVFLGSDARREEYIKKLDLRFKKNLSGKKLKTQIIVYFW
jgi:hypothetical protein